MRKTSLLLVICLCIALLCGCTKSSDIKLFITQGDTALENKDYESALEYYEKAKSSGSNSNKVSALCNIISTYLDALKAYENKEYTKAAQIIDRLEYDYNGYTPIDDDMRALIRDIDIATNSDDRIDRALDELSEAIAESDFDLAYELINELDGYTLSNEQREEFDYQIDRMARKQANLGISPENETGPEKEPEPEEKPEPEKEPEEEPAKPTNDSEEKPVDKTPDTARNPSETDDVWYRVRKSWDDPSSQLSAFRSLENAKKEADANPGYKVFNENGKQVYP